MSEDLAKEVERLKAENEKLKSGRGQNASISFKVSQKGAVSAYGLGRFPVTLYKEQWQRLLQEKENLLQFIEDNDSQLKAKDF